MRRGVMVAALALLSMAALAQEEDDRTLLAPERMNAIINEASGDAEPHAQSLPCLKPLKPKA